MIELPTLYPHQTTVIEDVRRAMARHRAVILQAPPGMGKTRSAKWIVGNTLNRDVPAKQSGNVLFAVHRRSLVDNASDSFLESPELPHGLIMSGRETDWSQRVHVASIDTLLSWYVEGGEYQVDQTFDLVVFDECHSHVSKLIKWLKPHDEKRKELGLMPAFVLGLSATPEAKELPTLFGSIVQGPRTEWLIKQGFLSPFRYVRATQGQLDRLVKRAGEYTSASQDEAMKGLAGDLVRDWKKWGQGRPTVGFFHRLSYAQEACNLLRSAGVSAAYVDGSTPDEERRRLFRDLGDGSIEYLCNVGVVERGTNIPEIACVDLCLSIGSLSRYLQMIGRGSRTAEGKTDCLVIDHGGNIRGKNNHGFFEDHVDWILDNSKKVTKDHEGRPSIECPSCQRIYRGGSCVCGYEPTKAERKSQGLDFDGSELVEIKRTETKNQPKKQTCEQIMISALYMAHRSNRTWKQCLGIAYEIARKQGTKMKVPREVTIGGRSLMMLPYGHPDQNRRVKHLYDI